jgi:hypothetical protein
VSELSEQQAGNTASKQVRSSNNEEERGAEMNDESKF